MALSWTDLGVSLAINGGVSIAVFFIFNILRRMKFLTDFYGPKRKLSIPFRFRPPRLPSSLFTWMKPVFTLPDEQFVRCAGMDAYVYQSFLGLCVRLSALMLLLTFAMVLPTNLTGNFVEEQQREQQAQGVRAEECETSGDTTNSVQNAVNSEQNPCNVQSDDGLTFVVTDFDKTALTNIPDGSAKMWVHTIAIWIIALLVMKMLWAQYKEMVKWRILYLSWQRQGDTAHTVFVRDIPGTIQGTVIGRIHDNIDGTIGRILPKSFKDKIELAMEEGLDAVFRKTRVADAGGKVADKVQSRAELFNDDSHRAYLLPHEAEPRIGGEGGFAPARSLSGAQQDSFTSLRSRQTFQSVDSTQLDTARSTTSTKGRFAHPKQKGIDTSAGEREAEEALAQLDKDKAADLADRIDLANNPKRGPPTINGRRNLSNFESRRPNTDFDTWGQAEAALRAGLTVQEMTTREFVRTFGKQEVEFARSVKDEVKLAGMLQQYEKKKTALQDMTDQWISTLRRKKDVKRKKVKVDPRKYGDGAVERFGDRKRKIDKMEWSIFELNYLLDQMREEQAAAKDKETSAAFVTMERRQLAAAATGLMCYDELYWRTTPAPLPTELIWRNLALRGWERNLRGLLTWGVLVTIIFFFLPIVGALQSLVNLEAYRSGPGESDNFVDWLMDAPVLGSVIQSILPTLALKIVLIAVPIILKLCAKLLTRQPCLSGVDFEVGQKYFVFQFFVIFVITTIVGAMLQGGQSEGESNAIAALVDELREDWEQVFNWLGSSLPQQAGFFLIWILTNGLLAKGIQFLRLPGAVIFFLLHKLAGTKRQKKRTWSQQYMEYGTELPDHTLTFLLLLVFSVVQPFICLVSLMYFTAVFFYSRYDLLYVKREQFQSGGLQWPVIFEQCYVALMVFLVGNAALLAIKGFGPGVPLLIPLLVIAILFRSSVKATFERPMQQLSLHAAADLDRADQVRAAHSYGVEFLRRLCAGRKCMFRVDYKVESINREFGTVLLDIDGAKEYDWLRDLLPREEEEMERQKWDLEETKLGPKSERYVQPSLLEDQEEHDRTIREAQQVIEAVERAKDPAANESICLDSSDDEDDDDVSRSEGGPSRRADFDDLSGPVVTAGELPTAHDRV